MNDSERDFLRDVNVELSRDRRNLYGTSLTGSDDLSVWYSLGMIAACMLLFTVLLACVAAAALFAHLNSRKYDTPLANIVEDGSRRGWGGEGSSSGSERDSLESYASLRLVDSFSNIDLPPESTAEETFNLADTAEEEGDRPSSGLEITSGGLEEDLPPPPSPPRAGFQGIDEGIDVDVVTASGPPHPLPATDGEDDRVEDVRVSVPRPLPRRTIPATPRQEETDAEEVAGGTKVRVSSKKKRRSSSSSPGSSPGYHDRDGRLLSSAKELRISSYYRPDYRRHVPMRGIDIASDELFSPEE